MRTTLALLIVLTCTGAASAQNSGVDHNGATAKLGDASTFVPLTMLERIKLGGAYYTNPEIVSESSLAYTYDPTLFSSEPMADLKTLEKQKKVVCGKTLEASIEVVPCPAEPLQAAASNEKLKIISAESNLLGKPADGIVKKIDEPRKIQ